MIQTALAIPGDKLGLFLETLQLFPQLDAIACETTLFETPESCRALAASGLRCPLVTELLPNDALSAISTAESAHAVNLLYKNLFTTMTLAAGQNGTSLFSIPLRLDRIADDAWDDALDGMMPYLDRLLSAPMQNPFSCLVPVRFPKAFPTSNELERALTVCETANSAYHARRPMSTIEAGMKLCAIIHPDEKDADGVRITPDTFSRKELLRQVAAIMFNYAPAAGETLFDDEQMQWADFLKENDWDGTVVFNPVSFQQDSLEEICDDICGWMEMYGQ